MSLELPNPRSVFLPVVPSSVTGELKEYLNSLVLAIEQQFSRQFDNTYHIVSTGTSGTFVDSSGNTITVANGIIMNLT